MRIGLLIYGSLDTLSGGYLYDRKLVETLRTAGDQVEIVSLPWRSYERHLGDNFSAAFFRRLAGLDVDFLIQDELNHPSLFLLNSRLRGRVPYRIVGLVHHLRASEQHNRFLLPFYREIERRYLRTVDAFIFNSRTTRAAVMQLVGSSAASVVAHPGGDRLPVRIEEAQIRARAAEAGPLRILFLGNVIPRKGLHTLLEALGWLEPESWVLAVAGGLETDTAYAGRMAGLAARRGWEGRVSFLGPLPDEGLLPVLLRSQVLALPSQYEGFGIAYLEGMAAGLPAIATTGGAAHEIVAEGENGFLIAPGDVIRLAKLLGRLHRDRSALARMGVQARRSFEGRPGWDEGMARIRSFLAGL